MLPLIPLLLLSRLSNAQFAEIANLATSFLGPSLAGATSGAGALGQIGQLYSLAQAGIGLAGTGVDVLNKASQGNWFPAAIEQASLMQKNVAAMGQGGAGGGGGLPAGLGGLGGALGALGGGLGGGGGGGGNGGDGLGEEFGKSFPAPSVEDYEDNLPPAPSSTPSETLVPFPSLTSTTSKPIPITLFPDYGEKETTPSMLKAVEQKKKITIQLPKSPDYFEAKSTDSESEIVFTTDGDRKDEDLIPEPSVSKERVARSQQGKILDLHKLVEVLSKNNLKDKDIAEIVTQVEKNMEEEDISHRIDVDSNVRNISPDMYEKQQRILKATRDLREHILKEQQERDRLSLGPLSSSLPTDPPLTTSSTPFPPVTFPPSSTPHIHPRYQFTPPTTTPSSFAAVPYSPPPRPIPQQPLSHQLPHQLPPHQLPFQHPLHSFPSPPSHLQSPLYSISGQASPPVQVVYPQVVHLPSQQLYPYSLPSSYPPYAPYSPPQGPSLPAPPPPPNPAPPPPPSSSLPSYYTYQNANANTVTRGTVQMPITRETRVVEGRRPPMARRYRVVPHGTDPLVTNVGYRTTMTPRGVSGTGQQQQQQQVEPARTNEVVRKRHATGVSNRRISGGERAQRSLPKAQAAAQHRILASPLTGSTPSPRHFPPRTIKTQELTTPPTVRSVPSHSIVSREASPPRHSFSSLSIPSSVSHSPSSRSLSPLPLSSLPPSPPPPSSINLVTPFFVQSSTRHLPQRFASPSLRSDDDLLMERLPPLVQAPSIPRRN